MKKGTKTALILAAVLIVAGAVMGIAGWMAMGRSLDKGVDSMNRTEPKQQFFSSADSVNVDVYGYCVRVESTMGEDICVNWEESEKCRLTVTEDKGALVILQAKEPNKLFDFGIYSIFGWDSPELVISLPGDFRGDLILDTGAGECRVTGVNAQRLEIACGSGGAEVSRVDCSGGARISCGSGKTEVRTLTAEGDVFVSCGSGGMDIEGLASRTGSVTVENSSGHLDVCGVSALGDITVECSSGGVEVEEAAAGENLTVRSGSGGVEVENCWAENISAGTDSGSLKFEGLSATRSIELRTGSGGVSGELTGTLADYSHVQADTGSGSCNINDGYGGNPNGPVVNIKTGSGSINVDYEKE